MCDSEALEPGPAVRSWVQRRWQALGLDEGEASTTPGRSSGAVRSSPAASLRQTEVGQSAALARLGAALAGFASSGQPLLVTWTTGGRSFIQQALNFALSIRRHVPHLENQFVIVALDESAFTEIQDYGFQTLLHAVAKEDIADTVWKFRWQVLLSAVSRGLELAVADSDVVVFRDPFPLLGLDADLEIATEHFWPQRHLWQPWVRPEDDLSTGFVFARPSPVLQDFLARFLAENSASAMPGGLLRDPFDQRVFNKFLQSQASACSPCVVGLFENRTIDPTTGKPPTAKQGLDVMRIRVLDPVSVIANGVSFFWRRAHLLGTNGQAQLPALAHANGVGPKEYFLRDRGAWFLSPFEDPAERFGPEPHFLRYRHPSGLSLGDDFAFVAAALEVARSLQRRLILPNTMNCQNCPAYKAYNLDESLPGQGCTIDYFAYMFRFFHVHGDEVVDAGSANDEAFEDLWGPPEALPEDPQTAAAKATGAAFSGSGILDFRGDVRELRTALANGGKNGSSGHVVPHNCSYHEWPHRFMACRDDAFVKHGDGKSCVPASGQSACGLEGLVCCVSHHGRADRLEYYTGEKWDLPCNCGLDRCQEAEAPTLGVRCCQEKGNSQEGGSLCTWAADANSPEPPATNPEKDLPFASSSVLASFADGKLTAEEVWQQCERHRSVYFLVREALEGVPEADCNIMISNFLVARQSWSAARLWWRFSLAQRRSTSSRSSVSMEDGHPDQLVVDLGKLRHDASQMSSLASAQVVDQVHASRLDQLLEAYGRLLAGSRDRAEVLQAAAAAQSSYNRALHTPEGFELDSFALLDLEAASESLRLAVAMSAESKSGRAAQVKDFLDQGIAGRLAELLRRSTVWFLSRRGGTAVEAQLRDGLHAKPLLELGQLLSQVLPDSVSSKHLTDVRARSYDASESSSRSVGLECFDAEMAVMVVLGDGETGGATVRVLGGNISSQDADKVSSTCTPPASREEDREARRRLLAGGAQLSDRQELSAGVGGAVVWSSASAWHEVEVHAGTSRSLVLFFLYGQRPESSKQRLRRQAFMHEHDASIFKYDTSR